MFIRNIVIGALKTSKYARYEHKIITKADKLSKKYEKYI